MLTMQGKFFFRNISQKYQMHLLSFQNVIGPKEEMKTFLINHLQIDAVKVKGQQPVVQILPLIRLQFSRRIILLQ